MNDVFILIGIFTVFYYIVSTLSVGIYYVHYMKCNKIYQVILLLLFGWFLFPFILGSYLGQKFIDAGDL